MCPANASLLAGSAGARQGNLAGVSVVPVLKSMTKGAILKLVRLSVMDWLAAGVCCNAKLPNWPALSVLTGLLIVCRLLYRAPSNLSGGLRFAVVVELLEFHKGGRTRRWRLMVSAVRVAVWNASQSDGGCLSMRESCERWGVLAGYASLSAALRERFVGTGWVLYVETLLTFGRVTTSSFEGEALTR